MTESSSKVIVDTINLLAIDKLTKIESNVNVNENFENRSSNIVKVLKMIILI